MDIALDNDEERLALGVATEAVSQLQIKQCGEERHRPRSADAGIHRPQLAELRDNGPEVHPRCGHLEAKAGTTVDAKVFARPSGLAARASKAARGR